LPLREGAEADGRQRHRLVWTTHQPQPSSVLTLHFSASGHRWTARRPLWPSLKRRQLDGHCHWRHRRGRACRSPNSRGSQVQDKRVSASAEKLLLEPELHSSLRHLPRPE
ncbi:unnamed protein product, partial [Ectocarpus sp. 8 AP-2014]